MTTNDNLRGLKPCPFCGAVPELKKAGHDWYRIEHPHVTECLLDGITFDYPQTDEDLASGVGDWNTRTALAEPDSGEVVRDAERYRYIAALPQVWAVLGDEYDGVEDFAGAIDAAIAENKAPAKAEPEATQCAWPVGEFDNCRHAPLPGKRYCVNHQQWEEASADE